MNTTEVEQPKITATPPTQPEPTPRLLKAGAIMLVLIVAALIFGLVPRLRHKRALAAETRDLAVPSVTVVSPSPAKQVGGMLLSAEIRPWIEAPIYARASGYLKRWAVDLGSRVEAGQLLAEIETPELDQELERARHEVAQSEASLALAKITTDRYAGLLKTSSVSEQEAAEKHADFSLKTATVKAGQANVRRLEQLQSFARVTAPFAGVITLRKTDVGDLVAAGSTKELFRLAQTEKLRVSVHVPQNRALTTVPGQLAELLVSDQPGRVFTGQVARTAGMVSTDSRTLMTEIEIDNARGEILAGSFAQVRFPDLKASAPMTLPGNTLLFRAEGPQVGVVQSDGIVQLRDVKLGRDFGQAVEILAGVSLTNQVILNPSDSLANGDMVRVTALVKPEAGKPGSTK